jgi:esterase FrsA
MNNVDELKRFVVPHARGQKIPRYEELLHRITTDDEAAPGSWVHEWSDAGQRLERAGDLLGAARHYALGRFPFVDGPARREVQDRCVSTFDRWRMKERGMDSVEVELPGGRFRCWTNGLSTRDRKPLLVVMGGIVTVKEQWAPMLMNMRRLGMAGVVAEMPGIGENTLRYGTDSWQMLSAMLDAIGDRADVSQTYAMALSFSGHMALRCALDDSRIRGVITTGAPVSAFFTDQDWQSRLPKVTKDTLAHMIGTKPAKLTEGVLAGWALTGEQLAALDIPLAYVSCDRDDIIPAAAETQLLRDHVRHLDLVEHDDVHGAPSHVEEVQLWSARSLFQMRNVRNLQSTAIDLLWRAKRTKA